MIHRRDWRRRKGTYRVASDDTRSPMHRLLEDGHNVTSGLIEVNYAQQWRTLIKAIQLGYVDQNQKLTDKGRQWLQGNQS